MSNRKPHLISAYILLTITSYVTYCSQEHVSDRVAVMYLGKVVELAPADALYREPRHPYAAALLSAASVTDPDLARQRRRLTNEGDIPSPVDPPAGCRFHPRCPRAQDLCRVTEPPLEPAPGDQAHLTACHFPIEAPAALVTAPAITSEVTRGAALPAVVRLAEPAEPPVSAGSNGSAAATASVGLATAGTAAAPVPSEDFFSADEATASGPAPATSAAAGGAASGGVAQEGRAIEGRSQWRLAWDRLRHDRVAVTSAAFIAVLILLAIFAPAFAHLVGHGVNEQNDTAGLTPAGLPRPPTASYWFDTDDLGRDVFVRTIYGARISLIVGIFSSVSAVIIGTTIGLLAGFLGGWADSVLSRLMDLVLSFPFLLAAIALVSVAGPSLTIIIVVIALFSCAAWPCPSRVTPPARRRPWNVARQVASLDQLSGGRVTLGVGLGVSSGPEFHQFGEESDPRVRGDMLDEGLRLLRAAWRGTPVRHAGTYYQVDDVTFLPEPVQALLPIWGATEQLSGRPVRRAAALDGVFPIRLKPSDLPVLLGNVARHRPGGLDGYDVVVTGTDPGDCAAWREAGATWWLRELPWRRPLRESVAIVEAGPSAR
jgi:oligopeptide/dipeptide ABC transporter ATP-binding protein